MSNTQFDNIRNLIKVDVDAVEAYEQAIDKIDDTTVRDQMVVFKTDHQRHIDRLSDYLLEYGEEVPDKTPDLKGYLMEGFTALRSANNTDSALKAMRSNEKLTKKKYEEASGWDVEIELEDMILEHYEDENDHLKYIEEQLAVSAK